MKCPTAFSTREVLSKKTRCREDHRCGTLKLQLFYFPLFTKLSELRREYEDEMRVQLRRQAAAHSDHLSDVLRVQDKQHAVHMEQREMDVRQEERSRYQDKLNGAMNKLRGVEAAIEGKFTFYLS